MNFKLMCNDCSVKYSDYNSPNLYTWCTNCGNYAIHAAVKRALVANQIEPKNTVLCFDIGCHGNGSDKIGGYKFHALHGRVIPLATGAHLANSKIKVLAFGGDGGTLGEGINHLIHAVRANYDITFILHNNSNYGLTKGQASPSTPKEVPMDTSPDGVESEPINIINLLLDLNPSFLARTFSGDVNHMAEVISAGLNHKGFSFIEILQSCPTYNKATPHEWYLKHCFKVETLESYNVTDLEQVRDVTKDLTEKIAVGVLYKNDSLKDLKSKLLNREGVKTELVEEVNNHDIWELLKDFV